MVVTQRFAVEAHPQAATLYLTGSVSVAGLLEAFQRCEGLPHTVWMLRVDVSGAAPLDEGTRTVLAHLLRQSRAIRGWVTQVTPAQKRVSRRFERWRRRRVKPRAVFAAQHHDALAMGV